MTLVRRKSPTYTLALADYVAAGFVIQVAIPLFLDKLLADMLNSTYMLPRSSSADVK